MSGFIFIFLTLLIIAVYTAFLLLSISFNAKKNGRSFILVTLIIFSLGFIISMFLVRLFDNLFIRIIYNILALGLGLLFYLTAAAIFFQIIKLAKFKISLVLLARIGVAAALALFFIGIVQANVSHVKNISVTMSNLPDNWRCKKIVQISDLHLGNIYGREFLKKQIIKINDLNPDLIVITGDLFDGSMSNLVGVGEELDTLKAENGVIFVPGNHDTYLGLDKVELILKEANITILRDEAINLDGLEIIGFDFSKFSGDDYSRTIKNLDLNSTLPRLLLNHTPNDILLAKELKVNLQLSGHSHRGQMFPVSLMTRVLYGKYQYGLYTEGNYNIYTSSGLGSWGPPVRTFNQAEIIVITIN